MSGSHAYLRARTLHAMRVLLLLSVVMIAAWEIPNKSLPFKPHDKVTWTMIENNREQCKHVKQAIVDIINTQRACEDSSEFFALEQRFADLIICEDRLKKQQADMITKAMKGGMLRRHEID